MMLYRKLLLQLDKLDEAVNIAVYAPTRGKQDWSCQYSIGWPGGLRQGFGYGIDAMQAFLLALEAIGTDLYTSEHHRNGKLRWVAPGDGYGFPVPHTIRHLLIGSDAAHAGL